jgi:anti-sigma28 factor (negative regulator of flagellin synthesis)
MKIDGNRPNVDASAASRADAARIAAGKARDKDAHGAGDAVTVSGDVALAQQAIDAANKPAEVRPDAVARGKALLASGKLGADAQGLADTLIQRLLELE